MRRHVASVMLTTVLTAAGCGSSSAPQGGGSATPTPGLKEVHFTSTDGVRLDGHVAGTGSRWVVLSHMYPSDQTSWYSFAQRLAGQGLVALTYDFRGYGASSASKDIAHIDRDVLGAVVYAQSQGATAIALMGASMGGTASVVAAAENPSATALRALVTLSAPGSFMGLDAESVAARVGVTMLCVAGTGDAGGANATSAQHLCAAVPGRPVRTVELPDTASHGTALLGDPTAISVIDRAVRFLRDAMA